MTEQQPAESLSETPRPLPLTEPAIVDARTLFGPHRELWIEHEGIRYRLRITRRGKLILQK